VFADQSKSKSKSKSKRYKLNFFNFFSIFSIFFNFRTLALALALVKASEKGPLALALPSLALTQNKRCKNFNFCCLRAALFGFGAISSP
jgi:hypothetical protein